MQNFTIIDAHGFMFRAYYALPELKNKHGEAIGGVYGFISILLKYLANHCSDYLVAACDSSTQSFRKKIYSEYKANRRYPENLRSQFPLFLRAIDAFGIQRISINGYEADDVIASLVKRLTTSSREVKITIVSSDKDLMQLLSQQVHMFDCVKDRYIDKDYAEEKFGVSVDKLVDLFALAGDSSDNIPGVPGIGLKTAAQLIKQFTSLNNLLSSVHEIEKTRLRNLLTQHSAQAVMCRELVKLRDDLEITHSLQDFAYTITHTDEIEDFLREHNFHALIQRSKYLAPRVKQSAPIQEIRDIQKYITQCLYTGIVVIVITENEMLSTHDLNKEYIISNAQLEQLLHSEVFKSNAIARIIYTNKPNKQLIQYASEDIQTMAYMLYGKNQNLYVLANKYLKFSKLTSLVLLRLYFLFKTQLIKNSLFACYALVEKPLLKVIAKIEENGIAIDIKRLHELKEEFALLIQKLTQEIHELAGEKFNIASVQQLSDILFNKMQIRSNKKLKSGIYSTASEVLEQLVQQGHAIATKVLQWRHISKLKNTYIDVLLQRVNSTTERIYTTYATTVTTTGRIIASYPNVQNIPIRTETGRKIRGVFISAPDHFFLSADYSQIELRLLAHIADVQLFKEIFAQDLDIHTLTACEIFHVPAKKVDSTLRRRAKAINFGIIYGLSAFGLAQQLNISTREAGHYIKDYLHKYPGIEKYMHKTIAHSRAHGYVRTILGRKCFIEDKSERSAINAPIQGSAADIFKKALLALQEYRIVLQIHDELVFEIREDALTSAVQDIRTAMENVVQLSVPLKVTLKQGYNLTEMY